MSCTATPTKTWLKPPDTTSTMYHAVPSLDLAWHTSHTEGTSRASMRQNATSHFLPGKLALMRISGESRTMKRWQGECEISSSMIAMKKYEGMIGDMIYEK